MSEAVNKLPIAVSKSRGESMIEAEADAEMLLMTGAFRSPEKIEEPIEVTRIRDVLAGETDRFARLYEIYAPLVHGVLLARVPRSGHSLDKSQHESFAIRFRQGVNQIENLSRCFARGLRHRDLFSHFHCVAATVMKIHGAVTRDHRHPRPERLGVSQGM